MSTPKIVTKEWHDGRGVTAFWFTQGHEPLLAFSDHSIPLAKAHELAEQGRGWIARAVDAINVGTTLAAIRAELLALETPAPDASLTTSEREELVRLRKFAGWLLQHEDLAVVEWLEMQEYGESIGLVAAQPCDGTCGRCEGMARGEDTCYRPRYDEDGTPIGDTTRKDGTG